MNSFGQSVIALVFAALCVACSQRPAEQQQRADTEQTTAQKEGEDASCCTEQEAETAMSGESLYQLSSMWTNQNGKDIELQSLRGKPRVVAMIFTHCTFACPRITADMQAIEAQLPTHLQGKVGFVLFSIDPERDTPKALVSFAKKMNLDTSRWTLLRSDEDNVQEMAAVLGVKYKKESNGDFSHSNLITVLNQEGEIAYRQEGLNQEPQGAVDALATILQTQ